MIIMKNNIDYIYEYSDLNLFQIRVQILTSQYKDMILEFGSSVLIETATDNQFKFDYTIYQCPNNIKSSDIKDIKFINYLADLLINIIDDIRNDKDSKEKLDVAANQYNISKIIIDDKFYPEGYIRRGKTYEQPEVNGLQTF